jgi:hypothetical protein
MVAPVKFALYQNFPNPFNQSTVIEFDLPQDSHVLLEVFNVRGQRVKTLADDQFTSGRYKIEWQIKSLSSGVYYYQLKTENDIAVNKGVYIK